MASQVSKKNKIAQLISDHLRNHVNHSQTSISICCNYRGDKIVKSHTNEKFTNQGHYSMKVSWNIHENEEKINFDRKDLLLGLGGLYGASNLAPLALPSDKISSEQPIAALSLKTCIIAYIEGNIHVPYSLWPPWLPSGVVIDDYLRFQITKIKW